MINIFFAVLQEKRLFSIDWEVHTSMYILVLICNQLIDPGCCLDLSWINARCPPKPLYHSPSSVGQGRGNTMKDLRVETRTGRDPSPVTIMDKTD